MTSSSNIHSNGIILESSEGSLIGMIVHAIVCLSCACLFHTLIASIAGENARNQAAALAASLSKNNTQLELEVEDEDMTQTNGDYVQAGSHTDDSFETQSKTKQDSNYAAETRIGKLSKEDMMALTVKLWILMLLNYLLLVFLPGSVGLSFVAVFCIWGLTLHEYLLEELLRRKRIDRIVLLLALFFSIAMSLTAFTYHRITFQSGDVYQGSARIVGYDTSVYENSDGQSLRTNLEVNWGGQWACPRSDTQCQAVVEGALCQTKYDAQDYSRRALANDNDTETITYATDDKVKAEEEKFVDEVIDEATEEVEEYEEEVVEEANAEVTEYEEEVDEEATEEIEEVEAEAEDIEAEKEELEEEKEELEEEVEEEEEEVEELEEELNYEYGDDYYDADYWDYDWDSVWGEYACEDLFDQDVESLAPFDPETPPGSDDWPTVQIYGSCRSCDAFLMDYYTTEHFLAIQEFQAQYFIYALLSMFLYVVAGLLAIREQLRPSQEKQIVLLNNEGGVVA